MYTISSLIKTFDYGKKLLYRRLTLNAMYWSYH